MAFGVHGPVSVRARVASPMHGSAGRARHKAFTRAVPCHPRRALQSLRNGTGPDRPPDYLLLHHYARQKGCRRSMSPFSNHCHTNSCVVVPSMTHPSVLSRANANANAPASQHGRIARESSMSTFDAELDEFRSYMLAAGHPSIRPV